MRTWLASCTSYMAENPEEAQAVIATVPCLSACNQFLTNSLKLLKRAIADNHFARFA
jgi:hypothetical protein